MVILLAVLFWSFGDGTADEPNRDEDREVVQYRGRLSNMGQKLVLAPEDGGEPIVSTYGLPFSMAKKNMFRKDDPGTFRVRVNFRNGMNGEPVSLRARDVLEDDMEITLTHRETGAEVGVLFFNLHSRRLFVGTIRRTQFSITELEEDRDGNPLALRRHPMLPILTTGRFEIRSGDEWLGEIQLERKGFSLTLAATPASMPMADVLEGAMVFPLTARFVRPGERQHRGCYRIPQNEK